MIKPLSQQEIKICDEAKKLLLLNGFLTLFICSLFIVAIYFTIDSLLDKKLSLYSKGEAAQQVLQDDKGVNYNLGEFVVNLSDGAQRYLKADVTLELTRMQKEKSADAARIENDLIHQLEQYKAAMKDAVITVLSSKNASTLTTKEGKELVKEQIAQNIDTILNGEREVLRVNFSQFIIQ